MNKARIKIWGREFEIDISFQNFPGEKVTNKQQEILDSLESVDFSDSLEEVKHYILKRNRNELEGATIENIFRYVMPKSILITRDESSRVFAIICYYRFDMEHGLAVVYENEKFKTVGLQDIIL